MKAAAVVMPLLQSIDIDRSRVIFRDYPCFSAERKRMGGDWYVRPCGNATIEQGQMLVT